MIAKLVNNHPELRLSDPRYAPMIQLALADGDENDIRELLRLTIDQNTAEYIASGDPFWGNYPLPGSIKYAPDFIKIGCMPTSDEVGFNIDQIFRSIIVSGPLGFGKTVLLTHILSSPKLLAQARVIVFARKKELRHLATIPEISHLVNTFLLEELELSLIQFPPGVTGRVGINDLSRTTAQSYGIYSAHRLMNDVGIKLLDNHPKGVYPTLGQLIEALQRYKPRDHMRDAPLKTSIVSCLKDLLNCTGTIWDYSSSNFLEKLFSTPGLAIIEAPSLPQQHLSFMATYMMRWVYLWRNHLV